MQQVKQYKKQADVHATELNSFKDAHEAQKMQVHSFYIIDDSVCVYIVVMTLYQTNVF